MLYHIAFSLSTHAFTATLAICQDFMRQCHHAFKLRNETLFSKYDLAEQILQWSFFVTLQKSLKVFTESCSSVSC